ncbi:MAG TPA: threonine synthase [Gammaproteobacteria bacterium]
MHFISTRGGQDADLIGAVMQGLASDGGLFVPDALPRIDASQIRGESLAEIASELLAPFFAGSMLEDELADICADALDFPVVLRDLRGEPEPLAVLELFHGPTAAFKDVGARFLAALMERVLPRISGADPRPVTILVATSGDTGGAVAAAFHRRAGVRVGVFFPRGQVSPRQQHQLCCWGNNVRSFEVDGSFDDCQALVKAAFQDQALNHDLRLTAANSINLGRLLPQVAYHSAAALWHQRRHGSRLNCIVPTGNLGNALACIWARAIGFPIDRIVLAVNENVTIPDYLSTGEWRPRPSKMTLASAMDVGDPSNMERLRHLIPDFAEMRAMISAHPVDDASIRAQIAKDYEAYGEVWCPHTATGFHAYDHLSRAERSGKAWSVCATAHPAKFETIVEPIIGKTIPVPESLASILKLPAESIGLEPDIESLRTALADWN